MQFYVPIPWPLALIAGVFIGLARVIKWIAVRLIWPLLSHGAARLAYAGGFLWGYSRERVRRALSQRARLRAAARIEQEIDRIGREIEEYRAAREAGRVIDGEARRVD